MQKRTVSIVLLVALLLTMFQATSVSAAPSMEFWYKYWPAGAQEMGAGISADDVDDDSVIEIVTVGHAKGFADGIRRGSLLIVNYDGMTLNWEASSDWYTENDTEAREVCIKDVDNDGVKEILTIGKANGTLFSSYGQLRIWSWDGTTLALERSEEWITGFWSSAFDVCADDVDKDGMVEIVTVGYTEWYGQLKIWNWDGTTLTQEKSAEWNTDALGAEWDTIALGVYAGDVDDDDTMEIVTVGQLSPLGSGGFEPHQCQLRIWNWDGTTLDLENTSEWKPGPDPKGGNLVDVFMDDVDDDGDKEIVAAGRAYDGMYWNGYLTIQTWDGSTLTTEEDEKWYNIGDTEAFGVYIKDVDDDGDKEIVTVGALHVLPGYGQLKAYTWIGGVLTPEWNVEWSSGPWGDLSFAYDNYVEDVDGDGIMEILAVGRTAEGGLDRAMVTIWSLPQIPVHVDIRPGSWPNPLKLKSKGVLPVAVCGTEDFDVTTIDPETIRLTLEGLGVGVAPLRWSYEDVATPYTGEPCSGHDYEGDGYLDLTLKFKAQEVIATLGLDAFSDRDVVILILTGNLKEEHGGTLIQGQDCIVILDP